jgi:hypothetical protein
LENVLRVRPPPVTVPAVYTVNELLSTTSEFVLKELPVVVPYSNVDRAPVCVNVAMNISGAVVTGIVNPVVPADVKIVPPPVEL